MAQNKSRYRSTRTLSKEVGLVGSTVNKSVTAAVDSSVAGAVAQGFQSASLNMPNNFDVIRYKRLELRSIAIDKLEQIKKDYLAGILAILTDINGLASQLKISKEQAMAKRALEWATEIVALADTITPVS